MKLNLPDARRSLDLRSEQDVLLRDVEGLIRAGELSGAAPSPKDESALRDAL